MTPELPEGFKKGDQVPDTHYRPRPEAKRKKSVLEIQTLQDALDYFKAVTPNAVKGKKVMLKKSRVGVTFHISGKVHLLLFKRDMYRQFGKHFPDIPEEDKTQGMICNLKLVGWAAAANIEIVVVFPSREIYSIQGDRFWEYYDKYHTDVQHAPGEIASPIGLWKKW